jgi:hypothetical protein|tara:strand:- start:2364 stop:2876 length:513 start_codon:yes stop_codon:yes gene_type:complete
MILGKFKYLLLFTFLFISTQVYSEDKITTVPLINLDELEPSFEIESLEEETINDDKKTFLKKKNKSNIVYKGLSIKIRGLDKITAKTSEINIKIGKTKRFGLLEIKAIKCGKIDSINEPGEAAYIQVKDTSDTQNEKVFVFNGWTFSSSPSLRPIDHPVYDLWLIGCENV